MDCYQSICKIFIDYYSISMTSLGKSNKENCEAKNVDKLYEILHVNVKFHCNMIIL